MRPYAPNSRYRKGSRAPGRATISWTVSALLLLFGSAGDRGQSPASESDVKAAYLINFGKFLSSSDATVPHATFDVCLLGQDPVGHSIDEIAANESIDNHQVRVARVSDVTEAKSCAIAYISSSETERIREDLAILSGTDVLTVSDLPDFLKRGGMIQFVVVANQMRFAVNLDALNHAHLKLSSELLRVAASVTGTQKPEARP